MRSTIDLQNVITSASAVKLGADSSDMGARKVAKTLKLAHPRDGEPFIGE
jgi:hypothetical protein